MQCLHYAVGTAKNFEYKHVDNLTSFEESVKTENF